MTKNPYQQYQQQSILTMTPGELVLKLYDESMKRLNTAIYLIGEGGDPEEIEKCIKKAQQIIHYLDVSLDANYDVSNNLHLLYDYFIRTLVKANIRKRAEPLQEIVPMIGNLRNAFAQAEKKVHMK